ncbi:MAG: hypothetical protein OXC26_26145 [Albidovulum sp.]|nr:hypothetical protein [Albidovulum sp.]
MGNLRRFSSMLRTGDAVPNEKLGVDGCVEVRDFGDSPRFCRIACFFPFA